jgi:hypothetical protein
MKELLRKAMLFGMRCEIDIEYGDMTQTFDGWYNSKEVQDQITKMEQEIIDLKIRANS